MKITSFEEFKELARRGTFVPVCKEIVADLLTPVSAFLKIAEDADYAFLLESVEGGEHVGRYSFLGKDPFLILRARDGRTTIERGGVVTDSERPFIETLRGLMADFRSPFVPDLPRFTGGAVGYLGYGAASWFEPVLGDLGDGADGADQAGFMLFDTVLAFDHVQHRILIIANARITADDDLESLYQFACAKIQFLERELERNLSVAPDATPRRRSTCASNHTRERFEEQVRTAQGAHRRRRHLSGGAVAAVRGRGRGRSVHGLPRAAARQPVAVHVFHPDGRRVGRRLVAGDAGARRGIARRDASDRRHAAARPHRRRGHAAGRGAEAQREGARRARHARRSRPQRRRPRLRVRLGARAAVHGPRALLARHAPDVDRRGQARRRSRSARRAGVVLSGRHGVGRAEGARDADHPRARAVGPRALRRRRRLSRFRRQPRFLHRDPHGHHVEAASAYVQAGAGIVMDSNPTAEYEETRDKARALLRALELAQAGL